MTNPSDTDHSSSIEKERHIVNITEIEPLGYGNPNAKISIVERMKDPFQAELIEKAVEIISSGEAFVPIDNDDDGCIDGRIASLVTFIKNLGAEETKPIDDQGHERAKVAGGGYITVLAMYIATKFNNGSVEEDLREVTEFLTEQGIYCGAHTGEHNNSHVHTTDCGANDRIDEIIQTAVTYAVEIRKTAEALIGVAGVKIDTSVIEKVQNKWEDAAASETYYIGSNGETRFNTIKEGMADAQVRSGSEKPVAVAKDLAGSHNEAIIVVNYRQGETLSQRKLQELMVAAYPDVDPSELPQVFVVDAWRVVKLAQAFVAANQEVDIEAALYAGVGYQVATAATLTDGSLRVLIAQ